MSDAGRCTALVGPDSRCGDAKIVREFTTALYPEGPVIRLCAGHERRWHAAIIAGIKNERVDDYERMADTWRYEADAFYMRGG